jgi:hypothetical protein
LDFLLRVEEEEAELLVDLEVWVFVAEVVVQK